MEQWALLINQEEHIDSSWYGHILERDDLCLEDKRQLINKLVLRGIQPNQNIHSTCVKIRTEDDARYFFRMFHEIPSIHDCKGNCRYGVFEDAFETHGLALFDDLYHYGYVLSIPNRVVNSTRPTEEKLKVLESIPKSIRKDTLYSLVDCATYQKYTEENVLLLNKIMDMGFISHYFSWSLFPNYPDQLEHNESMEDFIRMKTVVCLRLLDNIEPNNIAVQRYCQYVTPCNVSNVERETRSQIDQHKTIIIGRRFYKRKIAILKKDKEEYETVYGISYDVVCADEDLIKKRGICSHWLRGRCKYTPIKHTRRGNQLPKNYQGKCNYYHGRL